MSALMAWHGLFPQRARRNYSSFCDLVSKVRCHHFWVILFVRSESLSPMHITRRGVRLHLLKERESKNLGTYLETITEKLRTK